MIRYQSVLILYAIVTLVKAGSDKEDGQGEGTTKAMDGCRGFCDDLDGYFCLDFFGICEPCNQAECHSHDRSFCPPKCEDYFRRPPSTFASPTRTPTKSTTPDRPQEQTTTNSSMHTPSSEPFGADITYSNLLIIYIFVPIAATSAILILVLLHVCIGPRTMSLLAGNLRLRGTRDDTPEAFSGDMKIRSKLPPNPAVYVAVPRLPADKLAYNDYVTSL